MTPLAEHHPAAEPPVQNAVVFPAPSGRFPTWRLRRAIKRALRGRPPMDVVVLAAPKGEGARLASKLVSDNWRHGWEEVAPSGVSAEEGVKP